MASGKIFSGYIDLPSGDGIESLEVYKETYNGNIYLNAYIGGDLMDDVNTVGEFTDAYGDNLYQSLEDYKKGNVESLYTFWSQEGNIIK